MASTVVVLYTLVMTQTTGDLIAESLDLMTRNGWCRESTLNDLGQSCAWGAVSIVASNGTSSGIRKTNQVSDAMGALADHIPTDFREKHFAYGSGLPKATLNLSMCISYNNSRESFEEIKEWFEKTALDEGVTL